MAPRPLLKLSLKLRPVGRGRVKDGPVSHPWRKWRTKRIPDRLEIRRVNPGRVPRLNRLKMEVKEEEEVEVKVDEAVMDGVVNPGRRSPIRPIMCPRKWTTRVRINPMERVKLIRDR